MGGGDSGGAPCWNFCLAFFPLCSPWLFMFLETFVISVVEARHFLESDGYNSLLCYLSLLCLTPSPASL